MPTKVIMPQLGESVVEGTVSKWLKQEGESIAEYESLLEVNTDKVDSEIPSPAGGTVLRILVPEGETVRAGTILAWIGQPGEQVPGQAGGNGGGQAQPAANSAQGRAVAQAQAAPESPSAAAAVQETAQNERAPSMEPSGASAPPAPQPPAPGRNRDLGFISPVVAKLAAENRLDLTQITGTGQGGRITKKDVLDYLEQRTPAQAGAPDGAGAPISAAPQPAEAPAWETPGEGDLFRPTEMVFANRQPPAQSKPAQAPAPQPQTASTQRQPEAQPQPAQAQPGGRVVPLSTMRRKIAEHMAQSVRTSPHVTTVMEADLSRVVAHYKANKPALARDGIHLTYSAYFAAATALAMRAVPLANSSWTDEGILIHPQVNLGIAVSLGDEGLIVPVIKNADGLSLLGLARAIKDLADRARGKALQPDDTRGGTMTITNHGVTGSLFATPIINQPQCGIVGVGAVQKRVVVTADDAIAVRPMVYLSFTFDHRILDGASADGFLGALVDALENWK